jgi:hypothetical protein
VPDDLVSRHRALAADFADLGHDELLAGPFSSAADDSRKQALCKPILKPGQPEGTPPVLCSEDEEAREGCPFGRASRPALLWAQSRGRFHFLRLPVLVLVSMIFFDDDESDARRPGRVSGEP